MIKITALQTGTVSIKTKQQAGADGRSAFGRKIDMLRDIVWSPPLPILAYLIEHPEGNFVVDTGDTWRNSLRGYLPRWNPFYTTQVIVKVGPLEEVGELIRARGLDPARDIGTVLMTHMHHDHAGGLYHFPHSRIVVSRENWKAAKSLSGMVQGNLPQRWPIWLKPDLVEANGAAIGPFARSKQITADGRILMVETPGHCKGHMSVIVRGEGLTWFITGDATYSEDNLRANLVDGVTYNPALSRASQAKISEFAESEPTIVLPSHDEKAADRLQRDIIFRR